MTVVHSKHANYDVYIGRAAGGRVTGEPGTTGFWGNPVTLEEDTELSRKACLVKYWEWLTETPEGELRLDHVHELKDKVLGCWCAPKLCHGHILERLAGSRGPGYVDRWLYCVRKIEEFRRELREAGRDA